MKLKAATDRVDVMFRAFSDRTRLRILNLLRGGETCVCDLVGVIGAPQPKVSRHLAYLRRAGLVVGRKDGLWMHYSLTPARSAFHKSLLNCLACCFRSVPELKKDAERLGRTECKTTDDAGGCCPG
ncbi:MAG TPA: metalloregulator ArsR/SmtB family transcription factor [Tepidisphaeraceae bacterium]|nr:metalloregulator ArsR/SmtB family transcription factor [Tepidisphaeraceae bacterium]